MRIAIDATAAVSGGRIYLNELLPRLARLAEGDEFIVFHTENFDVSWSQAAGGRFSFQRVGLPGAGGSVLKMLWRLLMLPWHLRRLRPDLLFSNSGFGPLWWPRKTGLVVAIHNSMPLRDELIAQESTLAGRWRLRLLRWLTGHSVRRSDGVIVFSADTAHGLNRCFGKLKTEPVVIFHGTDQGADERAVSVNASALSQCGLTQPYLLFVSHLHRYKNVVRLIEAFSLIAAAYPALSLVLVGEAADRIYQAEIEAAIARLGLNARVKHVPGCEREELKNIYRGALGFVQPSLAETFSLPLAEALAMGLPAAAARSGALPEVAGEAAIWFDPLNQAEMAAALRRLVSDEALRRELSAKAVIQAQRFSWEESARLTLAVFREAAKVQR